MGCSRTSKELMVVWVGWRQQQDQTWRRLTRSFDTIDFRGQRGSESMSRSSHHHHNLAHSIGRAKLDNIHGLKFRHWRETATPTRLVGVCYKEIFQPRTVGAGECATLAKSKAQTKSQKSTVGRNLCSKLSSGGDDLDQSIVGINDLERF